MRRAFRGFAICFLLTASVLPAGTVCAAVAEIDADALRTADDVMLPLRRWLPVGSPRAVILALHGFGDYSVAFQKPAAFWAAHGIATYAFDQRGFGGAPHAYRWAGAQTMIADAKTAIGLLHRDYPGIPVYLMGESMGGALAITATVGPDAADVAGAILVSPAIWEQDLIGSVERLALWMTKSAVPGLWLEPPRGLGIHPSNNIEMLRTMARDSLIHHGARVDTTAGLMELMDQAARDIGKIRLPTLVLFGAHEEVLPKPAVQAFLGHLPADNVRVALYPEGYHMLLRDLDGALIWQDVLNWIEDHRAPLPSGNACAGLAATAPPCRTKGD